MILSTTMSIQTMFNNYSVSVYDKNGLYDILLTDIIAESEKHAFNILIKEHPINLHEHVVFIKKIADGRPKLKCDLVDVEFDESGKVIKTGLYKTDGEFPKEFSVKLRLDVDDVSIILLDDGRNINADFYDNVTHKHIKFIGCINNHVSKPKPNGYTDLFKNFLVHELDMIQQECDNDIYRYHNSNPKPQWIQDLERIEQVIEKFNKLVDEL